MNMESFISDMMRLNVLARIWHWSTDIGQHHVTYEQFLTQNEQFTDSFVESTLGNDIKINLSNIGIESAMVKDYSLENARKEIVDCRIRVTKAQQHIGEMGVPAANELTAILDDVVELCSKTLYLLKLK